MDRTWFVLTVLVAATALVALGKLTGADWKTLVMVLGGMLVHQAALNAPSPEPTP
jgi:hypothetical protein